MADRFYGYQYDTNPRKLNSDYVPYRNRYPRKEEPVTTTTTRNRTNSKVKSNNKNKGTNREHIEQRRKNITEYETRQVSRKRTYDESYGDVKIGNEVEKNVNSGNVKITKAKVKARLKVVMFLLASFSVLFAISYQNSLINESFNRKEQYKKELEALSKTNQQIEIGIENSLNLTNIEQVAKEKLGMQKLNNNQKIYVSLPKEDYVAPAAEQIVMEEDLNFFERIFKWFTNK